MKKFLAVLLSGIMVMAMGLTGMAVNSVVFESTDDTMTFTTDLLMSDTAITAPDVTFVYTIALGDGGDFDDNTEIFTGITGATVESVTFSPDDALAPGATDRTFTDDVEVDFSEVDWTAPGIYHYTITATASTVDGIVMDDDNTREVYVYVVYDEEETESDTLIIKNIIMTDDAATTTAVTEGEDGADDFLNEVTKSEGFVNGYGIDPDEHPSNTTDTIEYENLIITNTVEGNMADRDKAFTVTLTADSDTIDTGTIFEVANTNTGSTEYIRWDGTYFVTTIYDNGWSTDAGSEALVFHLKDGESYTIYSVVANMEFTTTMTDEDNYTILSQIDTDTKSTDEVRVLTNKINADGVDDSNNYFPNYDLTIPDTGVILELLPFVLIVLFAGALMVIRFTKATRRSK